MKLSDLSLKHLVPIINGDCEYTPYLSGPKIIEIFNMIGIRDLYSGALPGNLSRGQYVKKILFELNNTLGLRKLIEIVFDSRNFLETEFDIEIAVENLNKVILHDKYKLENFDGIYKIIGEDSPEAISTDIHFEDIQEQIKERIKTAKFTIWVAVAWFTNRDLANELWLKLKEGLNIRIIINDDDINKIQLEEYFETMRIKPTGKYGNNIMHNKFCIIDFKTVIHGSYNWTNKAQWNHETIEILDSRGSAEEFSQKFMELVKIYKNQNNTPNVEEIND